MTTGDDYPEEPGNLRLLRRLVTVLMVVMIVGLTVLVALFVLRFSQGRAVGLPDAITLPADEEARAITYGSGWYGVVTASGLFLIYDARSGALRQTVQIKTEE